MNVFTLLLCHNRFGNSRRFGFIGYKTDKDARAALAHFNNTFIDTSKIIVEKAKEVHIRIYSQCRIVKKILDMLHYYAMY